MRSIFLAIALLLSVGCASVSDTFVFNGDSSQTIQKDISYLYKKLPRDKKQQMLVALLAIQFSDVNSVYDMLGDPAMERMNYDILSKKLDGLTYAQMLELASTSKTKVVVSRN